MLSPTLRFSDSLGLGGGWRVCISNKISDGVSRDSLSHLVNTDMFQPPSHRDCIRNGVIMA